MKKYYNIYRIEKETNDIVNVYGGENREEVANFLQVRLDNFSKYTTRDIDSKPQKTKIINNQHYFVIIDNF